MKMGKSIKNLCSWINLNISNIASKIYEKHVRIHNS